MHPHVRTTITRKPHTSNGVSFKAVNYGG